MEKLRKLLLTSWLGFQFVESALHGSVSSSSRSSSSEDELSVGSLPKGLDIIQKALTSSPKARCDYIGCYVGLFNLYQRGKKTPLEAARAALVAHRLVNFSNEISSEIRAIRRSMTTDGHINGIWNGISNWVFDPVNGYITRPQEMHTAYSGRKGFSDFHTLQYIGTNRRFFLITQCKKPTTGDKIWKEGREQLDR